MMKEHKPGDTFVRGIRLKVCRECGCEIDGTGACDYGCKQDYGPHPKGSYVWRVYERTDKFIRDESD